MSGNVSLGKFEPGGEAAALDTSELIHALVTGSTGAGKSSALRLILEGSKGVIPQVIISPEDEFTTLEGDYVRVGKDWDFPASPVSAGVLARKTLEGGFDLLVDLSDLRPDERRAWVQQFVAALNEAPRSMWRDVLIAIDEAHNFAPQKLKRGEGAEVVDCKDAITELVATGRKKGYKVILATQRLAKLDKDAAFECGTKLVGRTLAKDDQDRALEELGAIGDSPKNDRELLRKLEPGEFLVVGKGVSGTVRKLKFTRPRTAPPPRGQDARRTRKLERSKAIEQVLAALADLPKEAEKEAHDLAEANARVVELQRRVKALEREAAQREKHGGVVGGVPAEKFEELQGAYRELQVASRKQSALFDAFVAESQRFADAVALSVDKYRAKLDSEREAESRAVLERVVRVEKQRERSSVTSGVKAAEGKWKKEKLSEALEETSSDLTGPMQRILNTVAELHDVGFEAPSKDMLAAFSGYRVGGAFNNYLGALRSAGLIEYPQPGTVACTDSGREAARPRDAPATVDDMQERALTTLPGPHQTILRVLLEEYPGDVSKEELAERTNYSVGGAFNNYVGRLRTIGMVEYPQPGRVKASKWLFLE